MSVLVCEGLSITYSGVVRAVRGVGFSVAPGECLALVGESGSGKSSIARAILGLLPGSARIEGSIRLQGRELVGLDDPELQKRRGLVAGFVWQNPFEACNPLAPISAHVAEAWQAHGDSASEQRIAEQLAHLGIDEPGRRMRLYPHQWSGGMLQRASIAAAAARHPPLIVADEPTSALDADRADAILATLRQQGAALLLVSHDARLVARHADRVAICYAGAIVEIGPAGRLISAPRHPYTLGLVEALPAGRGRLPKPLRGAPPDPARLPAGCAFAPRCNRADDDCLKAEPGLVDDVACHVPPPKAARGESGPAPGTARPRPAGPPLLTARGLSRRYGGPAGQLAVAAADLELGAGEIVGISGPSGCGKSTLLRLLSGMEAPSSGEVVHAGRQGRPAPGSVMPIFQDAAASIDERWPIWRSIVEPATAPHRPRQDKAALRQLARTLLERVGLGHLDLDARPAELSGGQCQRVAIARVLAADARLVIADEPTSALDPSVSATILLLLRQLADSGTAIVIVSHDRPMLDALCDRVLVMEGGVLEGRAPPPATPPQPRGLARRAVAESLG